MASSSVFPQGERPLATIPCQPNPDIAVYYDGVQAIVPTKTNGLLRFDGAQCTVADIDAPGYTVELDQILAGPGRGVAFRGCIAPTKQRLRLGVTASLTETVMLELKPISYCNGPKLYDIEQPLFVVYEEGRVETACQKAQELARLFNSYYSEYGVATVVLELGVYYLDIETKTAGDTFHIQGKDGLTNPRSVVPGRPATYLPTLVPYLFANVAAPAGTCMKAAEIRFRQANDGHLLGAMTSSLGQDTKTQEWVERNLVVLFAANANGDAAYQALFDALKTETRLYPAGATLTTIDQPAYPYSLERADAGDTAAYNQVKTDYPAALSVWTVSRNTSTGKTLYTFTTASNAAPAAVGADVISVGSANVPTGALAIACP